MDSRTNENYAELPSVETPEDVAVLYSWANLHGAKYRDFSASRREYRAQLRHRAAEQSRDTELQAQEEAEDAALQAAELSREAEAEAAHRASLAEEGARQAAQREADLAIQRASAERIEAARRAEAAADAEAAARREEREIAEAHASAQRQAALYTESRRRRPSQEEEVMTEVPGKVSDPYTPESRQPLPADEMPPAHLELLPQRTRAEQSHRHTAVAPQPIYAPAQPVQELRRVAGNEAPARPLAPPATPIRRPQGYRPDDASGVRQIYSPDRIPPRQPQESERPVSGSPMRPLASVRSVPVYATRETTLPEIAHQTNAQPAPRQTAAQPRSTAAPAPAERRPPVQEPPAPSWTPASVADPRDPRPAPASPPELAEQPYFPERRRASPTAAVDPNVAGETADPVPRRRRQDQPGYRVTDSDRAIAAYRRDQAQAHAIPVPPPAAAPPTPDLLPRREPVPPPAAGLPAWIHDPQAPDDAPAGSHTSHDGAPAAFSGMPEVSAETLQRSRERVASRWYALKGVFEQPGAEHAQAPPPRQRETRTPVLAVFSFAGGVGKTSLVATLGRSLSSLGEKVLLTDTTSHGLLPFYFGASELRERTVRTFSPPSGSTDAPIYLVNYAVDQPLADEGAQEAVVDSITENGRGAHRILLDLTSSTAWLIRRMAHLSPTILVPLAPDMNSVISLQSIERFLHGVDGADGNPVKVFYLLNQFDAGLPLHLDVREVLRRQLGDRLLPIVIRRAPAVSEALAEGMTIIDYAADAPVAEDYLNVAHWLRSVAAPATAGFRNQRWSER